MGGSLEPKKIMKTFGDEREKKKIDRFKFAADAQENINWHLREAIVKFRSSFSFSISLNFLSEGSSSLLTGISRAPEDSVSGASSILMRVD